MSSNILIPKTKLKMHIKKCNIYELDIYLKRHLHHLQM